MIKKRKMSETVIFYAAIAAFIFIYCKFMICYENYAMPNYYLESSLNTEFSAIITTSIPLTTSYYTTAKIISLTTVSIKITGDDKVD